MNNDPFVDSRSLALWASEVLMARGIDQVADWRMIEYWIQVELFRAVQTGLAGDWRHVGTYEHPYHTELPKTGAKTNTKWIDLVLGEPDPAVPERVVWIELKDLGRSKATALNNIKGLGHDLAALWALSPTGTKELWLNPLPHSLDRGRVDEWDRFAYGVDCEKQPIAQVVLAHKVLSEVAEPGIVKERWLSSFVSRCNGAADTRDVDIAFSDTEEFRVYGLVGRWRPPANNSFNTDAGIVGAG